jgi:hypothetical protein
VEWTYVDGSGVEDSGMGQSGVEWNDVEGSGVDQSIVEWNEVM